MTKQVIFESHEDALIKIKDADENWVVIPRTSGGWSVTIIDWASGIAQIMEYSDDGFVNTCLKKQMTPAINFYNASGKEGHWNNGSFKIYADQEEEGAGIEFCIGDSHYS